jgi:hypothetical protein
MGFDIRYPFLHRLHSAPILSTQERREAERIAKRLHDNTGLSCAFNAYTGDLFFYYRSPHGGPFSMPYYDAVTKSCRKYSDAEIGDYIKLARYGQMSVAEKEAIAARNKKIMDSMEMGKIEKHTEDRAPDVKDYADFLNKRRRGTQKVMSV